MTATMGTCLALIFPKLHRDDVRVGGMTSPGTETNSPHRCRQNLDIVIPDICHLHRDSLGGLTAAEKAMIASTRHSEEVSGRRRTDVMSRHSIPSRSELQELFDSAESVFTTSSLGDERLSNRGYDNRSHDTQGVYDINKHHPRPSRTKALLEEFDISDRIHDLNPNNGSPTCATKSTKCTHNNHSDRATKSMTLSRPISNTDSCEQTVMSLKEMRRRNSSSGCDLIRARTTTTRHSHRSKTNTRHCHCDKNSSRTIPGSSGSSGSGSAHRGKITSCAGEHEPNNLEHSSAMGSSCLVESERELGELAKVTCKEGRTLLHNAAHQGDIKMVTKLLQCGAKVNARDNSKRTPLHEVANMGHVNVGRLLLEHGAKVNARNKWKCTPLHQAVAWKQAKMVHLLLQHDARATGGTLLQDVINMDPQDDVIVKMIARGADVNATDMTGQTPMHIAVKYGRANIMWLLLEAGANLNKVSRGMMEGNHGAVLTNARRQLAPLGLDGLLQDGWSPLRMAQKYKHFDLVVWLIKRGANIVVCDSMGRFPHHKATTQRNCPSLHHIVADANCPIDICDIDGNMAIKLNFEVHAKRMVDANPQCGCCTNQPGTTSAPSCNEYTNTTLLLLQHGADITDLYIHGYDLLHHLCSSRFSYDLRLLQGVLNSGNDLQGLLGSVQSCLNTLKRQLRLDMYEYLEYFFHSPRTLQDQCRLTIRSLLRRLRPGRSIWTTITSLPLPHALMDFLLLQSLQGATLTRHFPVGLVAPHQPQGGVALCELGRHPTHSLC